MVTRLNEKHLLQRDIATAAIAERQRALIPGHPDAGLGAKFLPRSRRSVGRRRGFHGQRLYNPHQDLGRSVNIRPPDHDFRPGRQE